MGRSALDKGFFFGLTVSSMLRKTGVSLSCDLRERDTCIVLPAAPFRYAPAV